MPRAEIRSLIFFLTASLAAASDFSGDAAMAYTKHIVAFGPRPPASPAITQMQTYLISELKKYGCAIEEDNFTATTPKGPMAMKNIICRFKGTSGKAIVFTGHYDTKIMPVRFVGANDGGSSAGFLLAMAMALKGKPRVHDVWLVFYDGEEAIGEWTATDGIHGSRHLADKWSKDGTLRRIRALVNVDMIGDKNLGIFWEGYSSPRLRQLIWQCANDLGYSKYFLKEGSMIEDDHVPFVRAGVEAVDLIDFDYPSWHTAEDTFDKLSAKSLQVVGDVLLEVLRRLEKE
jgi:Zn-dependent M28 family amino/carboxypeptidase